MLRHIHERYDGVGPHQASTDLTVDPSRASFFFPSPSIANVDVRCSVSAVLTGEALKPRAHICTVHGDEDGIAA